MGTSGVIEFTRVRPGCRLVHQVSLGSPWVRWVYPESLSSLAFTLGVVGFPRVRPVGGWVQSVSLASLGFVWFTRVRPGSSWVHLGYLVSLAFAIVIVGFIRGC